MSGDITIIIPTFNRVRALEAVWPSYIAQSGVDSIVVVDDGSTDATADKVREWSANSPVRVELVRHEVQLGQPAARMAGIARARTEWVLFGEDDVWLAPDYCETLEREARDLGASVIAGRIVTALVPGEFAESCLSDPPSPIRSHAEVFDLESMDARFGERIAGPMRAPFVHSIALIRRSLFASIGFDTWYSGNSWREETDFYLAAAATGALIYFTGSTVCFHLRGPISAVGGQRVNRLWFEYLAWRNTRYLVGKHWAHLQRAHGLRGSELGWMIRYYLRRQAAQLRRIAGGGLRSTYRG